MFPGTILVCSDEELDMSQNSLRGKYMEHSAEKSHPQTSVSETARTL